MSTVLHDPVVTDLITAVVAVAMDAVVMAEVVAAVAMDAVVMAEVVTTTAAIVVAVAVVVVTEIADVAMDAVEFQQNKGLETTTTTAANFNQEG
jgi:hypothetical protein